MVIITGVLLKSDIVKIKILSVLIGFRSRVFRTMLAASKKLSSPFGIRSRVIRTMVGKGSTTPCTYNSMTMMISESVWKASWSCSSLAWVSSFIISISFITLSSSSLLPTSTNFTANCLPETFSMHRYTTPNAPLPISSFKSYRSEKRLCFSIRLLLGMYFFDRESTTTTTPPLSTATLLLQKKYGEGEDRTHDLLAGKHEKISSTSPGSNPRPTGWEGNMWSALHSTR